MIVEIGNVNLANVWQDSFIDRQTGEEVKYFRALVTQTGEPPAQLAVAAEDFEELVSCIGTQGNALVEIDAQPGRRVRVYLKEMK